MTELNALLEESSVWPVQPSMYISTLSITKNKPDASCYRIGECDRNTPFQIVRVFQKSIAIAFKERPDIIVTTGSLPLAIFAIASRLFGCKVIWIDSISQIDKISMSGRLVKPFADKFFVQWPELAARYPDAIYRGELI